MADELTLGYRTGATLTYGAYQPSGTVRTAAGTSLPEIGATGYYTVSDAALVALDFIVVKEGTNVVAQGQFRPEVTVPGLTDDLSTILTDLTNIEAKEDTLIAGQGSVLNVYGQAGAGAVAKVIQLEEPQDIGYFRRKRFAKYA